MQVGMSTGTVHIGLQVGMNNPTFSRSFKDRCCYGNRFLARIYEN